MPTQQQIDIYDHEKMMVRLREHGYHIDMYMVHVEKRLGALATTLDKLGTSTTSVKERLVEICALLESAESLPVVRDAQVGPGDDVRSHVTKFLVGHVREKKGADIQNTTFYGAYRAWAISSGEKSILSPRRLARIIGHCGLTMKTVYNKETGGTMRAVLDVEILPLAASQSSSNP